MEELELTVKPRPIKWSKEEVFALIKLWKKWDLLYDKNSNLYYNKLVRANVLELISKNLQEYNPEMTANEVRIKMHNLRTQLAAELVKISSSQRDGVKYEPMIYWFDEMQFLKNFVNAKTTGKFKRKKVEVAQTETRDENTMSDSDELLVPLSQEPIMVESSMSDNDDPLLSSKQEREYDESLPSETYEPTSTNKTENISRENNNEEAEEKNNDDVLTLSKNITLNLSLDENSTTPEQEYENSITNFFRTNIRDVKDKDLQDELALKIMALVFEYKRKQRELDRRLQ